MGTEKNCRSMFWLLRREIQYVFINNYAVTQMCLFTFTYDYFEHVFHVTYIRIVFTILYFVIRTLNLCVWLPYDTVILKSKMLFFRRKNDAIFSGVGVKNCTPPLPKKSIFPLSAFLESRETKHLFLFRKLRCPGLVLVGVFLFGCFESRHLPKNKI